MNTDFHFPSVLIPHVWEKITKEYIISVFEKLQIADVARVDMIPRNNSNSFMAFVHMNCWYDNIASNNLRNKIIEGEEGRVVYNDPWHWVVVIAKNPRLNLISEVSNYNNDMSATVENYNNNRIRKIKESITLLANQAEAQGQMIRYLRDDLFQADSYIFELQEKINLLQRENTEEKIHKNKDEMNTKQRFVPKFSGKDLDYRAIQWASNTFLIDTIPIELIKARETSSTDKIAQISYNYKGTEYSSVEEFIQYNCTEHWNWASEYPDILYDEHISVLADSYKQACFEYTEQINILTDFGKDKKMSMAIKIKDETSGAQSPSKLPTPSSTKYIVEPVVKGNKLVVDTTYNISDDEIDDGDMDCGDFTEMASRHVAKELQLIKNKRGESGNFASML